MIWNGRLEVIRNFQTDLTLPKWNATKKANTHDDDNESEDESPSDFQMASGGIFTGVKRGAIVGSGSITTKSVYSLYNDERAFYDWAAMSWWQRLWHSLKGVFSRKKPERRDNRPSLKEIKRVFDGMIDNVGFLASVAAENSNNDSSATSVLLLELAAYSKMIEQARSNGQTALAEKLQDNCVLFLYEAMLAACGFKRFVSEKMLVDYLTLHSDKKPDDETEEVRYYSGFRLDWMKNFTRVLPPEVAKQKRLADSLMIFDNYVVFHYDPDRAASAMTRAEEEAARKDPILFGLIKGSDKLYFIADWVDEFCDLTLKEVVDKLKAADYDDEHFDLKVTDYRKKLGTVGQALVDAELKDLDEIKRLAKIWLA